MRLPTYSPYNKSSTTVGGVWGGHHRPIAFVLLRLNTLYWTHTPHFRRVPVELNFTISTTWFFFKRSAIQEDYTPFPNQLFSFEKVPGLLGWEVYPHIITKTLRHSSTLSTQICCHIIIQSSSESRVLSHPGSIRGPPHFLHNLLGACVLFVWDSDINQSE